MNRLNPMQVANLTAQGRYPDGRNLYLSIRNGGKSWVFRFKSPMTRRERDMGLGPVHTVSLAQARALARDARQVVLAGRDPLEERQALQAAAREAAADRLNFGEAAARYIEAHRAGWRNAKHASQWQSTIDTHAKAILAMPVANIGTEHVMRVLQPIWRTRTETATRLRGRIERILGWCAVQGLRPTDNPATWRGHLDALLPPANKVRKVVNRPAVDIDDAPAFMRELRQRDGLAPLALELQILTAARPGEVMGARWEEVDLDAGLWTIPASRMKADKEHRVPLVPRAVEILEALPRTGPLVFPGVRDRPLTTAAGQKMVKEMRPGKTAHGFRSTFRDWAGDRTAHPREIVEGCLAHALGGVEAAYRRGDALERRLRVLTDWQSFLERPASGASVTDIAKARGAK